MSAYQGRQCDCLILLEGKMKRRRYIFQFQLRGTTDSVTMSPMQLYSFIRKISAAPCLFERRTRVLSFVCGSTMNREYNRVKERRGISRIFCSYIYICIYKEQILHAAGKIPFRKNAAANHRGMPQGSSCGVIETRYIIILYNL